ncbi:dipeptide ABC transporter ATP-binding protein [Agromyces sp. MMS24-JH15]|uniref:dipeptide ABC transporter ATP-binding protein n=1 Tax=Agromyces sp. MMS24-JH15 TaxID=3243765 RepID=UPI0037485C8C
MTTPLVEIENLSVDFPTKRGVTHAVQGISFHVDPGECFAIVGESGSGKSVSARCLVGLNGRAATVSASKLEFAGRDLLRLSPDQWRDLRGKDVGFILQDALVSLDPLRTIGAEVGELLRTHKIVPREEIATRVNELLTLAGIPDADIRARQHSHELSGGLRQRALIASAIGGNPSLIIADEPTTALDVTVQRQILELLERLCSDGTSLLLVSHDLSVVSRLADRVAVMHNGVIVETGPTDEVLGSPRDPYTKRLLAAVPSAHPKGARLSGPRATLTQVEDRSPLRPPRVTSDGGVPLLEGTDLVKTYPGPGGSTRTAVAGVSFRLDAGRSLGIVGESGSGKTTLARMALGLVEPDSGTVLLGGEPWSDLRERARRPRRTQLQVISQDPLGSFDPRYDVQKIIGEVLSAIKLPRQQFKSRTLELLDQVGLDGDFVSRNPLQLSGGQRQRVAIARALAAEPSVIVCDEPVSALDISIQAQILDLLGDLKSELGVSLLFISHDLSVVYHVCDDVLVMTDGRVVESGSVEDVFRNPLHPYTQVLFEAFPRLPTDQLLEATHG